MVREFKRRNIFAVWLGLPLITLGSTRSSGTTRSTTRPGDSYSNELSQLEEHPPLLG
jgi:hypothetical protein